MNHVVLTGKVLNCYIHDRTGAFICKIAVTHDHIVGKQSFSCESVFNVVMQDDRKIEHLDVMQGDKVQVDGYIKVDITKSLAGNEHRKLTVYATNIEVIKQKVDYRIFDSTRAALGMEAI